MKETVDWIEERKEKKKKDTSFMTKFEQRNKDENGNFVKEYSLEHQKE